MTRVCGQWSKSQAEAPVTPAILQRTRTKEQKQGKEAAGNGNNLGLQASLATVPVQKARPDEVHKKQTVGAEGNKNITTLQLKASREQTENRTGMPDQLKSGLEQLSGFDLSDVRVHYNSAKPKKLNALAYAQGHDIHLGPRQENQLPHEGWHVVQQMQGRVKQTIKAPGMAINANRTLEREADQRGEQATDYRKPQVETNGHMIVQGTHQETPSADSCRPPTQIPPPHHSNMAPIIQLKIGNDGDNRNVIDRRTNTVYRAKKEGDNYALYDLQTSKRIRAEIEPDNEDYCLLVSPSGIEGTSAQDTEDEAEQGGLTKSRIRRKRKRDQKEDKSAQWGKSEDGADWEGPMDWCYTDDPDDKDYTDVPMTGGSDKAERATGKRTNHERVTATSTQKSGERKAKKRRKKTRKEDFKKQEGYDSDNSSDTELEPRERYELREDDPITAGDTTVFVGADRVTAVELIKIVSEETNKFIQTQVTDQDLPNFNPELGTRQIHSGGEWIRGLGTMAKMVPGTMRRPLHKGAEFKSMQHPIAPRTSRETGYLSVGEAQKKMEFVLRGKMIRVAPPGGTDLKYEEVREELQKLKARTLATDSEIAVELLNLIRTGKGTEKGKFSNDHEAITLLNYINTLALGLEGSRLNESMFEYIAVLEEVFTGGMTVEEAFYKAPYGGRFPMATTGAVDQKGQITTRRAGLLKPPPKASNRKVSEKVWQKRGHRTGEIKPTVKHFRGRQQAHLVILKETLLLVKLARRLVSSQELVSGKTLSAEFARYVRDTLHYYFAQTAKPRAAESGRRTTGDPGSHVVKLATWSEAESRSWNRGDRFEIEGEGNYNIVLEHKQAGMPFEKGGLWRKLRGG